MKEQELSKLEKRVNELLLWKDSLQKQRISFPTDINSRASLDKGLFVFTGKIIPATGTAASDLTPAVEIDINGEKRWIIISFPLHQFTANATTDFITNSGGAHNLNNGDRILLTTTVTLPDPLGFVTYYVVNKTGSTFQVSTSFGGSAEDIIDTGSGNHYWGKIDLFIQ